MKNIFILLILLFFMKSGHTQNLLAVPDTLNGTNFNLDIVDTSHIFYPGFSTQTIGINASYLGPTLLLNKGDSINFSINNFLMDTTTVHWHGMHVSGMNDGGPHIVIPPASTWNPGFEVRDHASIYWYHAHMHMMTNMHATQGLAGIVIVRDSAEATINLPRTYGIDDFPMVIQSKCFDSNKQILIGNAYDSVMMVNGTIDPYLPVPAQVVRLRLLNASSERVYNVGLQNNMVFQQIGTDGGLLDAPVPLTRLVLAPGERAEILVDFTGMSGQSINLLSYASEIPSAIYGAVQPGMGAGQVIPGYSTNLLNGNNFNIINFQVVAQTSAPITSIPSSLVTNIPWPTSSANSNKTLTFTPVNMGPTAIQGPFLINNVSFDMGTINYSIPLNSIELWTLTNQSPIAHPFHIHDVQFYITEINGAAAPANLQGRKDVVLVPAMQTVKFITKFETFCDAMAPYMYHCHMLPHEDDDMMGQFVVTCPTVAINEQEFPDALISVFPNPSEGRFIVSNHSGEQIQSVTIYDQQGKSIASHPASPEAQFEMDMSNFVDGIYIIELKVKQQLIRKKINLIK